MKFRTQDIHDVLDNMAKYAGHGDVCSAFRLWEAKSMAGGTSGGGTSDPDLVTSYTAADAGINQALAAASFPPNQPPLTPPELKDRWDLVQAIIKRLQDAITVMAPIPPVLPGQALPSVATTDVQYGPHGYPREI